MKTLSYAQNREDIVLNRAFSGRSAGFYIDVGACHPTVDSVTRLFYDRGWRGINIEPTPVLFQMLARERGRDINLPVGLSDREATLTFHEVPSALGFCTFSTERAEDLRRQGYELVEHAIPVTTLARVCEQHAATTIDFLKVDVESHERQVLEGADWSRFRPRVVLIEATRPATAIPCHEEWESLLLSSGYLFAFFDGLNRYYVREEDRDLMPALAVPANVLDDFEIFEHVDRVRDLEHQVRGLHEQTLRDEREIVAHRDRNGGLKSQVMSLEDQVIGLEDQVAFFEGQAKGLVRAYEEVALIRVALREACDEARITRQDLDGSRRDHAATLAELDEVRRIRDGMQAELVAARGRLELFEGWGPMTVSIVRRLRRISLQMPLAKPMLRRVLLLRRRLISAPTDGLAPQ